MSKGPVSEFVLHHYRHFNAAALVDAAKGYEQHLVEGGKMMITLAGAMSTAELGLSLAEMIRQDKVAIISCTGANLEEDIMNLVAHSHYKRVPNYRDLSPQEEWDLLENHYNRVTDTCIPEEEAFRRLQKHIHKVWKDADDKGVGFFQIGGGIAGDFPICVVPMMYQDLEWHDVPFWSYFCQISDSTTSYGSYSGAVPNEKITWGKLDIHTPKYVVESDATIVAPLIFAYVLGW
jgi:deoxyhypusine synthase